MTTKLSKIMTVFVAVASLSFMGFTFVSWIGGPNWVGEKDKLTRDYAFTLTPGENPTWAVTIKPTFGQEENVVTTPVLANAVITARQHQKAKQDEEIARLTAAIPPIQAELKKWVGDKDAGVPGLIDIDIAAMQARTTDREKLIENFDKSLVEIIESGDEIAQQALAIRATVTRRREDVFRLTSQLEDLQTDRYQTLEQKKRLRDLLFRIDGTLDRLERRRQQLIQAGARNSNDEEASLPNSE